MSEHSPIEELVAAALVGTGRKAPSWPKIEGELGEFLEALPETTPEAKLLQMVAAISAYESAGRKPATAARAIAPAVAETRKTCTRRASELLGQILAMTNPDLRDRLAEQWLEHAQRAGQRAPFNLVPALLDHGIRAKASQEKARVVAGRRGEWLTQFNPRWQMLATHAEDPESVWTIGSSEARASALRAVRASDPATARELVTSTWKEDAADDRTAFISAFEVGLSDADEPLLESALDDRSKNVRAAAAELLCRLPNSALARRMIERVTPLITFTSAKQRLLRKDVPAGLQVRLPPEMFDPGWARDGVVEKPTEKIGLRQWWLMQFIAAVPPTHWSTAWELSPKECLEVPAGEFADVVLAGWRRATLRHPDPAWIVALLGAAARYGRGTLAAELLTKVSQGEADALLVEIFRSSHVKPDEALSALRATHFELSDSSGRALCQRIDSSHGQSHGYGFVIGALHESATRLPPAFYDDLVSRWSAEAAGYLKKPRDEFFSTMALRRDMQREFLS